ncbi:MAG TPA: hypothetical protein VM366_13595 [Anaerolineae bacterium]|nr:hypothetical protein [Anaerolineae bacterium]
MLPLEYDGLVREYQRVDLLREAAQQRWARHAFPGRTRHVLREATMSVACRLPLPALEPVCAVQPV